MVFNGIPVYPETKGVPLEEMDAVFGEGKLTSLRTVMSRRLKTWFIRGDRGKNGRRRI